jgi:Holliday junction resolvase
MPARERRKGNVAEQAVARYLQSHGYPLAMSSRASRGGTQLGEDIIGIHGISIEIKNRRDIDISAALRQTFQQSNGQIPVLIVKPYGIGLESVGDWWAINYVRHQVPLWPKEDLL